MADNPETVLRAWFDELWCQKREDAIDRLLAADGKAHGLAPATLNGPDEFRVYYRTLRQAFPDIHVEVVRSMASGDTAVAHCRVTGTHSGAGIGPASHKPVEFWGFCMARVKDGKLVEGWNCFDFMTCYQQMGLLPELSV